MQKASAFNDRPMEERPMASIAPTASIPAPGSDRWTKSNATILAVCILGWAFDVYEQTILQIITPILLREWKMTMADMGNLQTISRWIGIVGVFIFPALADLYGRKPVLIWSILGFALFSGLTGFATGWGMMLVLTAITRIALSGENPVGMVMVTETAPTKWRATALGGLVGGYPLGYLLCTLTALVVLPLWGWRAMYWLGIIPALLVLWIRIGIQESPRFERVTAAMIRQGIKKQFNIFEPFKRYPREMVIGTLIYFFYLFTWIGWSAWMPQFLAVEKKLGIPTMLQYLSVWMAVAIAAYWICGWLCDHFGRRWVIPAFVIPAAGLLWYIAGLNDASSLFWVGLALNFLITGSFGAGLGYVPELFPTQIRGTSFGAAFFVGLAGGSTAPLVLGYIATGKSLAAGLPVLAVSFFLIAPIFLWLARDTTRKELTDFVGQKAA
jgi:MFS family permease